MESHPETVRRKRRHHVPQVRPAVHFTPPRQTRRDKTVLSRHVGQRESGITLLLAVFIRYDTIYTVPRENDIDVGRHDFDVRQPILIILWAEMLRRNVIKW